VATDNSRNHNDLAELRQYKRLGKNMRSKLVLRHNGLPKDQEGRDDRKVTITDGGEEINNVNEGHSRRQ
jgi:hypothetical protein